MTIILAIDPGPIHSAWLVLQDGKPALVGGTITGRPMHAFGIDPNDDLLMSLRVAGLPNGLLCRPDVVVIEQIRSYGMSVGAEIFDTVHWSGQFTEAVHPTPVVQLPRLAVKQALCHDSRAKDSNIRQALIDRFGGPAAIRKGGPLYGISKDVWAALGVAVTHADQIGGPA